MANTELRAAETLLENGIKIKVAAPWLLRLFFIKTITLRLRQSSYGTLMRVSRYYLQSGVTLEDLEDITQQDAMQLCVDKGHYFTRGLACAILNGYIAGALFTRPLSAWLRWKLPAKTICAITELLVLFGGTADFMSTIRSMAMMTVTRPTNLSPETNEGS